MQACIIRQAISACRPGLVAQLHADLLALQVQTFSSSASQEPSAAHTERTGPSEHHTSYPDRSSTPQHQQPGAQKKKRVVFLGTPPFSALILRDLVEASHKPSSEPFEIAAVVSRRPGTKGMTQAESSSTTTTTSPSTSDSEEAASSDPSSSEARKSADASPCKQERGSRLRASAGGTPPLSAVEHTARDLGIRPESILCPASAKEEGFLCALETLKPDLCITAAYGQILPTRFLDLPSRGTVNIHPSLLPKYRGAAPVQRALLDGVNETGVSVAYTVFKCDAGPVLAQQRVEVAPEEQAPELTHRLFQLGSQLLLHHLPSILSGQAKHVAVPQAEEHSTHAAKLTREDSHLDLSKPADVVHNKVRALAGWPGARASLLLEEHRGDPSSAQPIEIKILRTKVLQRLPPPSHPPHVPRNPQLQAHGAPSQAQHQHTLPEGEVGLIEGCMIVPCGHSTLLEVLEVRLSGRGSKGSSLSGREFMIGLAKRRLLLPKQRP